VGNVSKNSKFPLDGLDVNLLRLFCIIVECNGFSAAQARTNISAASISSKMSALELRLGLKLCRRGRAGFRLTAEGLSVYEAAAAMFQSHNAFVRDVGELRKKLTGRLDIGVVDTTVTNPEMPLSSAVARFHDKYSDVYLAMQIMEPAQLERGLLEGSLHVAIAPFYHRVPGLHYEPFVVEVHLLHCGRGHPLFEQAPDNVDIEAIARSKYVIRGHVPANIELASERVVDSASVIDMEAMMHLILSGRFVGFLPMHFARFWTACDQIRPLLPNRIRHVSHFEVAAKRDRMNERLTKAFLGELLRSAPGTAPR
jgi:DNA-binding transcriptional LysR family regulator